jgi:hypothetical protein
MERIAIAMQYGGAGAGARHEAAARPTSFCLAAEPLYGPPGRGDFLVSNFYPGAIPGNLVRNDFWRSGGPGGEMGWPVFGLPPWKKFSAA